MTASATAIDHSVTTVNQMLAGVANCDTAGLYFRDDTHQVAFVSWREHLRRSAHRADAINRELDQQLSTQEPKHVAVLLNNVPEFSYLIAAAALGEFVLVGLNPTRRGNALVEDLRTADCRMVIVHNHTTHLLDGVPSDITVVNIDSSDWTGLLDRHPWADSQLPVFPEVDPQSLLMLIFTSGTSGNPKAVRCPHSLFATSSQLVARKFDLGPADVAYLSMPLFHSNAIIAGWMTALRVGASVALRERFSATQFFDDVRDFGATYANYVGKPLSYLLAAEPRPNDTDNPLRYLYGNEANPADMEAISQRFAVTVVDGFGSTEGGVAIARTADTPPDALGPLTEPTAIVDPDSGRTCGTNEVGELVNTSGPGLFSGYYNNPEATAERMRGGIYHTGDLAFVDANGYVRFAGRLGDWLRVDGENLGTGPIERILLRHPSVSLAAVYGVPAEVGDHIVAALVLCAPITARELTEFLSTQTDLGPKQWPHQIRILDDLPRTATFKVLKRELQTQTDAPTWIQRDGSYQVP